MVPISVGAQIVTCDSLNWPSESEVSPKIIFKI